MSIRSVGNRETRNLLALSFLVVAACSGGDTPQGPSGPPVVATITVSPATPALASLGATQQFTAVARDAAGTVISEQAFTWSSTSPAVATVHPSSGLATAVANGTTTVRATIGAVTGSAALQVAQVATSVEVSPTARTLLAAGLTHQFTVTARDALGNAVAGAAAQWRSSLPAIAAVGAGTGLVTAVAPGVAVIAARVGAAEDSASVTVRNGTLVDDLVLLTDFGSVTDNAYLTGGIFAVWWHPSVDRSSDAQVILDRLAGVRTASLQLGLNDPPNPAFGTYVNIYIHTPGPGNDNYPDGWGNGVGTDGNGLPYMTLPVGFHMDHSNHLHEGFHLFQYQHSSPGFEYAGDAAWFAEASANWFAAIGLPGQNTPFIAAATIPANPQQALWHGFNNHAPGDRLNWNRQVRQYGLNTLLYYLTEHTGLARADLVAGYNAGTTQSPQQYLFTQVPNLRSRFADWAAHNTAEMDYLSRPQWTAAQAEIVTYGEADDINPYVGEFTDAGTNGAWFEPAAALSPRGWSYNVIRIASSAAATYSFELDGSPAGSAGAPAHFEARVLTRRPGVDAIQAMTMQSAVAGALSVAAAADASEVFLIVAAVPAHFGGNQTYSYRVRIARTTP
jgi:hypothetical protein